MEKDLSKNFYFTSREKYMSAAIKNRLVDRELEVQTIKDGIVLPTRVVNGKYQGGVCDKDFNFIAGYYRHNPHTYKGNLDVWATVTTSYSVDRNELTYLDEDVIFGGALMGHFGHFMIECWSRLWYVIQPPPPSANLNHDAKILFITTTHDGYKSWFDEFFKLMGIEKERIIYVSKPMQCRSVIVPEQSFYTDDWCFTKEYFVPYETIKNNVTPNNVKKLYLTRREFEDDDNIGVHCYNEKYFEDFFVARGFTPISMEKLSIEEQVSLIVGADEIASILGTLSHWALFCKSTTKFIMLSRGEYYGGFQAIANAVSEVDAYVIDCSKNFLYANAAVGLILFKANECWKNFVADYFHEQIDENDDKLYFEEELEKYVTLWLKKYSDRKDISVPSVSKLCTHSLKMERNLEFINKTIKSRSLLVYQTHAAEKGWSDWTVERQISNSIIQKLDIQAIKIDFSSQFCNVFYSVYYNEQEGWSQEVSNSKIAGIVGKRKPIFGIKIRLDDTGREKYDICYRVHTFDGKWTSWARNGEEIISPNVKLNSLQIKLENKQKFLFEQIEPGKFTINKEKI